MKHNDTIWAFFPISKQPFIASSVRQNFMTKTVLKIVSHLPLIKIIVGFPQLAYPFRSSKLEHTFYGCLIHAALVTPSMGITVFEFTFIGIAV